MRKFNLTFWFCLAVNFIFIQGCHKQEPFIETIPEQLRVYSIFQAGSFWIYKNETTREIDSTFIHFPPQFTYFQVDEYLFFELCDINYGGTLISSSLSSWDEYRITKKNELSSPCLRSASFQPGYIYSYYHNTYFKNISYFDSLIINDNVFYDVMNTLYKTTNENQDTLTYTFYLAKSVGLVKLNLKINNFDTTWSLLRYHVVQ
jgi:hypothetical protein